MTTATDAHRTQGFTLADARREFWKHPSPWMIGATLVVALIARIARRRLAAHRRGRAVGDAGALSRSSSGSFTCSSCIGARSGVGRAHDRLAAGPQAPRASRRPARRSVIFIPWKSLCSGCCRSRLRLRCWRFRDLGLGLTFLVFIAVARSGLRVDPLPDPQRLQAENPCLPGDLAQPSAAPLQERALLVHRHQLRHGRPGAADLSRSRHGRDLADREEPARHRGLTGQALACRAESADRRNPVSQNKNEHGEQADVGNDDGRSDRIGIQGSSRAPGVPPC